MKTENQLQIEFIQNNNIVQTKSFKLDIKVTNIGNQPFLGATVKDIQIRSADNQQLIEPIEKDFYINAINPGQSIIIEMGKVGTYMYGLAHIQFNLTPDNNEVSIITKQKNNFTGELSNGGNNSWIDFFYIKTRDEHTRDKTNSLLLKITIIMALMTLIQIYFTKKQFDYTKVENTQEINQLERDQNTTREQSN